MAKNSKQATVDATEDDLLAQLKAQPKVDVLGILLPNNLGGYAPQDGLIWLLTFSFGCWRIVEGKVHREDLVVRRLIRKTLVDREMRKLMAAIRPNTVTHIQARVAEHSVWDRPEALLEKVIGED